MGTEHNQILIQDTDVSKPLPLPIPQNVPFSRQRRVHGQLQLVKIVHRRACATTKDVHGIGMHHTNMRIAWNRSRTLCDQGRPCPGVKVKNMRIRKMPRPIVSAVKD
jgi:hypothetical protein